MTITQKERDLLTDLKNQEQLCVDKYDKYACDACDGELKSIFTQIKENEQKHYNTINEIMGGTEPQFKPASTASCAVCNCVSKCDETQKKADAYLCNDALSMEKHVSSLYNTCIFEFSNPTVRDVLSSIQKEEQNHGEQLYTYMSANGMYQ